MRLLALVAATAAVSVFAAPAMATPVATSDGSYARQYDIDTKAWKDAGGRYVAGSADAGARDATANYKKGTVGELKLGDGRIRIAGALLPQPTERYDHQFGLEPYATTYSGYVMARNLL